MDRPARTEVVVIYQTQTGTMKMVHPSRASAIAMMIGQTAAGNVVQSVYEREPQMFTRERYPELYE